MAARQLDIFNTGSGADFSGQWLDFQSKGLGFEFYWEKIYVSLTYPLGSTQILVLNLVLNYSKLIKTKTQKRLLLTYNLSKTLPIIYPDGTIRL